MKLLISPSNQLVKVLNDEKETLKAFTTNCITISSLMYQKHNEDTWNEVRVSYTTNPSCIIINGKPYKENLLLDICSDREIKSFFIADTSSIALYDNGKII